MKLLAFLLALAAGFLAAGLDAQAAEADHAAPWCRAHDGQLEYVLTDRSRVDCLTADYAVEVDYAEKWAEAIGQALFYAAMTGKRPGVVLLLRAPGDSRHLRRFAQAVAVWGLPVELWAVPIYEL